VEGEKVTERPQRKPIDGQTKEHDQLIAELKRRQDHRMAAASTSPSQVHSNTLNNKDVILGPLWWSGRDFR